jgi:hypothetical protein
MAVTKITLGTCTEATAITYPATAAVGSDGESSPKYLATIDPTGIRGLMLLRLENADSSNTEKATLWAGGLDFMNPTAKIENTMAAATVYDYIIDPDNYKQQSGPYKGLIVVQGASTDTKVAAFALPYHA